MMKVPQQNIIRFYREQEGLTISEIARRMKIHWSTAKKYADKEDYSPTMPPVNRHMPVLGDFVEIIDAWLEEDRTAPRKQRHTATRIYTRLKEEHSFKGSPRTVSDYVTKRRRSMEFENAQYYQRLEFPPGDAQVDFYTLQVLKDEAYVDNKALVLSFPHSDNVFVHPMPSENQECFLEGLKRLFHEAGGVPRRILFDNLSAAVVKVGKGDERQLTDAFIRFASHYRFDPRFCNKGKGNEKGHVENSCGYTRRNWAVPIPIFKSQEVLAEHFRERAVLARKETHYVKGVSIEDLWEDERQSLLSLPEVPFEVFRLESAVVNNYGEVTFGGTKHPVYRSSPGATVLLKVMWDQVTVLDNVQQVIHQFQRPYSDRKTPIPWPEVLSSLIRKPRSVEHSQIVKCLPDKIQTFIRVQDPELRKTRLEALRSWVLVYGFPDIEAAFDQAGTDDRISTISQLLSLTGKRVTRSETFEESYTPRIIKDQVMALSVYDRLMEGGEMNESGTGRNLPSTPVSPCSGYPQPGC